VDYRISLDRQGNQNPYEYMIRNLIMTGSNSGIADKRGALLIAAQRSVSGASQTDSNTDKIHLSKGAQNYLGGFRAGLSEALRNMTPLTPQMLGVALPSKLQEIFKAFSETATVGKVTEYVPLYYGVTDHGTVDPYLDNVDYFPEVVKAYEAEYVKLNEMHESGQLDEAQYKSSLEAVNDLFDDFVDQVDMSAVLTPGGIEHPLFAMRHEYNADYKQAFLNARTYIEKNGSLTGITDEVLSEGMSAINASTIRDMFSDEGKLLLYDTAVLADECERQEASEKLDMLYKRLTGAPVEENAETQKSEQESEELKSLLNKNLEALRTAVSESNVEEALKFALETTLGWIGRNYFGMADGKVSFSTYYKQMLGHMSESE
jgi:hypothetical protein